MDLVAQIWETPLNTHIVCPKLNDAHGDVEATDRFVELIDDIFWLFLNVQNQENNRKLLIRHEIFYFTTFTTLNT